jgi:hypothetical protein
MSLGLVNISIFIEIDGESSVDLPEIEDWLNAGKRWSFRVWCVKAGAFIYAEAYRRDAYAYSFRYLTCPFSRMDFGFMRLFEYA